jgi:hypothetical protein
LGTKDAIQGTLDWYAAGAAGVFLFNRSDAWTTLRHLPYPELLRQELAQDQPFGKQAYPGCKALGIVRIPVFCYTSDILAGALTLWAGKTGGGV